MPNSAACQADPHVAVEIAQLPVRSRQMFPRQQVAGIDRQRLLRPIDGLLVAALVPVRERDLQVNERRMRIACQRSLLPFEAGIQTPERLHQAAV